MTKTVTRRYRYPDPAPAGDDSTQPSYQVNSRRSPPPDEFDGKGMDRARAAFRRMDKAMDRMIFMSDELEDGRFDDMTEMRRLRRNRRGKEGE